MVLRLLWLLFLSAALLTGYAAGIPSSQPEQPAVSEPAGSILVDDPDSPYPMTTERWSVDMDGDGADELVELRAEKGYFGNEIEPEKWFEGDGMHPYTLVVTRGETVYELPIGREDNDSPPLLPMYWDRERTGRRWEQGPSGEPILLLWFDGLSRELDVYAAAFWDGEPVLLSAQEIEAAWPNWTDGLNG